MSDEADDQNTPEPDAAEPITIDPTAPVTPEDTMMLDAEQKSDDPGNVATMDMLDSVELSDPGRAFATFSAIEGGERSED